MVPYLSLNPLNSLMLPQLELRVLLLLLMRNLLLLLRELRLLLDELRLLLLLNELLLGELLLNQLLLLNELLLLLLNELRLLLHLRLLLLDRDGRVGGRRCRIANALLLNPLDLRNGKSQRVKD